VYGLELQRTNTLQSSSSCSCDVVTNNGGWREFGVEVCTMLHEMGLKQDRGSVVRGR
jgi:hypothetical protein